MTIRGALLLLLFPLVRQDEIQKYIDDLRDGDIAARETAELRLIEAGAPALPLLESLAGTTDADLKPRVARVIATIRLNEKRAAAMKAAVRVTVEARERPFRDVVKRVDSAAGFETWIDKDVEDRNITATLKSVSYLKAITEICRAHGAARIAIHDDHYVSEMNAWRRDAPGKRPMFQVIAGKSTREPLQFEGPFRISLSHFSRYRSMQACPWNFWMNIEVLWAPDARVAGLENIYLDVLKDDQGRDLIRREGVRDTEAGFTNTGPEPNIYDARFFVGEQSPLIDEAKAFSRVEGRVPIWLAAGFTTVRIDQPAKRLNTAFSAGRFTLTLLRVEVVEGGCDVVYTAAYEGKGDSWWLRPGNPNPALALRFLDEDGKELKSGEAKPLSKKEWTTLVCRVPLKDGRTLASMELTAWTDFFRIEVPFAFKDVRLPQW